MPINKFMVRFSGLSGQIINHNSMAQQISLPTDRKIFDGEIATYWVDDGILISLSPQKEQLRTS